MNSAEERRTELTNADIRALVWCKTCGAPVGKRCGPVLRYFPTLHGSYSRVHVARRAAAADMLATRECWAAHPQLLGPQ